ncbi:MAG: hypothetical protein DIU79_05190 [Actinobacteria bacterium]|nr:MAG: hypothetical protein DIU79_05190 [Actinomycetota bacterium]
MVYVRLDAEWTDDKGVTHAAGDMVDVDAATLANLEARGIVRGIDLGRGDFKGRKDPAGWAGPTSEPQGWAGPTGGRP